jgi:histone H2B
VVPTSCDYTTAGKVPTEKKEADKKTAAPSREKKKRTKTGKEMKTEANWPTQEVTG